jgi:nickel transport protein
MKNHLRLKKKVLRWVAWVPLWVLMAGSASAHRVNVFAWIEGEIIHTQSKFSGGKMVKGGEVIVFDLEGEELLRGKTNDRGEFSFKIPQKTPLKIVLEAGMGHKGEWTVPLDEIDPPSAQGATSAETVEAVGTRSDESVSGSLPSGLTAEALQHVVERALDNKLKPLIKMVAESRQRGPSIRDILGGIGYIIGLMGMAAYLRYRRKWQRQ